ncbi:biogenesis of lysosome-related organelles complex 1 subunit 6 [Venturia canescens]|uniref:biogenesis of lysosome-related organelles complex 1 subunit 6 n=1 Tax=Venturia canescens TaxID=32260 RepID=UPI001C9D23DD|nr:biogenesis of lysosome-related organelles complex 1 subunit 6-like [Venturia canescens]
MMKDIGEEAAAEVQPNLEFADRDTPIVDFSQSTTKLANGLLAIYQPPLEQIKKELDDLTKKQESLMDRMLVENIKITDLAEDIALNEMVSTIKLYQGKLGSIKREMTSIHDRTSKLKKRALRLQQMKQKEALTREHQREQELRREQDLIGKPSTV